MGVHKVWTCDLCDQEWSRAEIMRFAVRGPDDRPEDADNVDVGLCCRDKLISDVIAIAANARHLAVTGG